MGDKKKLERAWKAGGILCERHSRQQGALSCSHYRRSSQAARHGYGRQQAAASTPQPTSRPKTSTKQIIQSNSAIILIACMDVWISHRTPAIDSSASQPPTHPMSVPPSGTESWTVYSPDPPSTYIAFPRTPLRIVTIFDCCKLLSSW